jgi:hypothetical protein
LFHNLVSKSCLTMYYLTVCMPTCVPAGLLACKPSFYIGHCFPAPFLPACLFLMVGFFSPSRPGHTYWYACFVCLPVRSAFLPAFLSACLYAACVHDCCLPVYLASCLPVYPAYMYVFLHPACLLAKVCFFPDMPRLPSY